MVSFFLNLGFLYRRYWLFSLLLSCAAIINLSVSAFSSVIFSQKIWDWPFFLFFVLNFKPCSRFILQFLLSFYLLWFWKSFKWNLLSGSRYFQRPSLKFEQTIEEFLPEHIPQTWHGADSLPHRFFPHY